MVNLKSKKLESLLWLANGLIILVLLNIVVQHVPLRLDLTEEKRYTIKTPTKKILRELDDEVYVEVFLEGDLNASFKRLQKSIRETLEEFRIQSGNRIRYTFTNPSTALSEQARTEFMQELASRGITPTNVIERTDGEASEKLIFPGAIISYGGFETGVMLLKGNKARTPDEEINQSIEGLEYELANAIYKLTNLDRKRVGFVYGHGELDSLEIASFNNALLERYDVFRVDLNRKNSLAQYAALIIAKPTQSFSESEKLQLDQYIMQGGKVLFLLDKLGASMDSASREDHFAFPYNLNLDDQLFRYGVRINMDLIQDRNAALYPVVTGERNGRPQLQLMDWPFFPLMSDYPDHPATRNLDAVMLRFVSSIDTVKADGVTKIPLLQTSAYSRSLVAPVKVSVNDIRNKVSPDAFSQSNIPVGYLLKGVFTSLYKNRFLPDSTVTNFKSSSIPTQLIVIADGDIARNDVNPRTGQPQALGYDPFSRYTFANEELLLNLMAYLTDQDGLILARNKEVKIRPLDKTKIKNERVYWQVINLVLPLIVIVMFGVLRMWWRKQQYSKF